MGTMPKSESGPSRAGAVSPSLITNQTLLSLYAGLLKRRAIEEQARSLGAGRPAQRSFAAAIEGVAMSLLPDDTIISAGHPALPQCCSRAALDDPARLLRRPQKNEPSAAAMGTAALLAVGAAMAHKAAGNPQVVVAFLAGRGAEPGAWRKAMQAAGAHKLPVLFVRTGSRYVVNQRRLDQAYGFPHMVVDGSDVVAIYRVACESLAHARKGNGPTLIECRIEPSADAVLTMERYLTGKNLLRKGLRSKILSGVRRELRAARRAVRKTPAAG